MKTIRYLAVELVTDRVDGDLTSAQEDQVEGLVSFGQRVMKECTNLALLESLQRAVTEMRRYQKLYFKNRLSGDLHIAKQWESIVDKCLDDIKRAESPAPEATQDALL